jgi:uracil-DNA glycosylase
MSKALAQLSTQVAACRICRDSPRRLALPHEPRPVLRVSATARIAICGQAPGTRVHASGVPFADPSGDRLRQWMGIDCDTFYDQQRIAIVPMGFCFPGHDAKGGDLPPRRECAPAWRQRVFDLMPDLRLMLLVGSYAVKWHLGKAARPTLTETVGHWRDFDNCFPLPHPSWRNNAWIKKNPWFEIDLLPELSAAINDQLKDT